ncbi:MAG: hypothetical protein H7645_12665 [Candidatus Heimdallarchaeota archaeon]|nr:hypothetical protein [Candidatus Heimdallarchaeota archaeon]MCK4771180.1 hypothetical protein [Candidatus Heimdallarchaeota archaeon]
MVWVSYGIGIFSIIALIIGLILVIMKQIRTSSTSVYYFISLIVFVLLWVIGDMILVYMSQINFERAALFWSKFNTISSMVAMVATILFVRTLTSRQLLNSTLVVIAFFLFGGLVGTTLSSDYSIVLQEVAGGKFDFFIANTGYVWIFFDGFLVIFAGSVFLGYLIRQALFLEKDHRKTLVVMIVGVIIAYFVSIIIYIIRKVVFAITNEIVMLHMELISVAVGALIMSYSIYLGGVEAFYYSSEISSIFIYNKDGYVVYSASLRKGSALEGMMIPSITRAFSSFAGELIGKEVFPKEIDLGVYSLIIEEQGNFICLISCKNPTAYVKQGIKNILTDLSPNMTEEEMTVLVEKYLVFKSNLHD